MKKVYVFSSLKCKACNKLKNLLFKNNISYNEIDVDLPRYELLWNEVSAQANSIALPMIFIQDENQSDGIIYIANKDWKTHEEVIEIIKRGTSN